MRLLSRHVVSALAAFGLAPFAAATSAKPNIIFILTDDQNWGGLSVPMDPEIPASGSSVIETPALAKLAQEGMRFSQAYAPAPVCSPTRISLLTGMTAAKNHWCKAAPNVTEGPSWKLLEPIQRVKDIPSSAVTFAELLKGVGYGTAHYGKWHLEGGGPAKHGFDEGDGATGNRDAESLTPPDPDGVFAMSDKAAAFARRMKSAGRPFYIQMSSYALHYAQNALPATIAKYREKMPDDRDKEVTRAAITEDFDTGLARLFKALDEAGLRDNTYVIYMADNGVAQRSGALRGGKGDLYEAGIRVPLIVRGPGVPAGSVCRTAVGGVDLFPTFCALAGVPAAKLPAGLAGGDLMPLLRTGKGEVNREAPGLTFHFPHYQGGTPCSAIVEGDWKLIHDYESNSDELYHLYQDIGERTNLVAKDAERAKALHEKLFARLRAEGADMPVANPDYDPSAPKQDAKKASHDKPAGGRKAGKHKGKSSGEDSEN